GAAVHASGEVLLGAWTVHFTPSGFNGKGINIRRPAQLINGLVIAPGAQFNFVKAAGPFTTANGYVTGAAIVHGEIKPDGVLGGGLCSAATTLFNAAVRAGLQIDKRVNHHFYITRYPVGLDATIWTSGNKAVANVVFTNDTGNPITIKAIGARRYVTFQVWGISDGRQVTWADPVITNVKPAGTNIVYADDVLPGRQRSYLSSSDGFDVVVGRTVTDAAGFVIHSDLFKSDYAPETGVIKRGRYPGDPAAGTVYAVITPKPTSPPPPTPTPTVSPPPTATPTPTGTPTPTATPSPTPTPTAAPTDTPLPLPTDTPTPSP
ncbi:MAG: VanW family protein, partial [Chloroflexota bacterium]|nr:VanW family protein [Chloroflexota bacterium]